MHVCMRSEKKAHTLTFSYIHILFTGANCVLEQNFPPSLIATTLSHALHSKSYTKIITLKHFFFTKIYFVISKNLFYFKFSIYFFFFLLTASTSTQKKNFFFSYNHTHFFVRYIMSSW